MCSRTLGARHGGEGANGSEGAGRRPGRRGAEKTKRRQGASYGRVEPDDFDEEDLDDDDIIEREASRLSRRCA